MLKKSLVFAKRFGLQWPVIIQAPMSGGITTPRLVAAVADSKGLGSFATGYLKTEQVVAGIREIKKLTSKPFAVNVFTSPGHLKKNTQDIQAYLQALNKFKRELAMPEEETLRADFLPEDNFREIVDVLLAEKVPIVSFVFGNLPMDVIQAFKKNDTYLIGTANSLEEARILADSGIDAIVAQGYEAGGHRGGFFTPIKRASIGTMALLPRVVDAIDLPIIASGGIMDGRGVVAAITLGASAVQMGTAFLTTKESGADPTYQKELINAKKSDVDLTTQTVAYSGKTVRGLNTDFIEVIEKNLPIIPPYPIPHVLSSPVRKEAAKQKATHIMSMWSGQGVPLITNDLTTAELLERLHVEIKSSLDDIAAYPVIHKL